MNGQTDRLMDVCDCRVIFATEKLLLVFILLELVLDDSKVGVEHLQ